MRVLQISDIHFKDGHGAANQGLVTRALIEKLKGLDYEAVVISGDIAQSGSQAEYRKAAKVIATIAGTRPVFLVPGNHDVDRKRAIKKTLVSAYANEEAYDANREDVLGDRARFQNFVDFADQFSFKWQNSCAVNRADFAEFALIGINTALLSYRDKEERKLCVDVVELEKTLLDIDTNRPVIAIGHHPLDLLIDWNSDRVGEILKRSQGGAQIYFCGHMHVDQGLSEQTVAGAELAVFQCGSLYQGTKWENSFRILEIKVSSPVESQLFRLNAKSGTFDFDESMSHPIAVNWPANVPQSTHPRQPTRGRGRRIAASMPQPAKPADTPEALIAQLDDHFSQVWEPEHMGTSFERVFWPVRLRKPNLIHASQAFIAAALLKRGLKMTLCLDDFGNTVPPTPFLERTKKHFAYVGADFSEVSVIYASQVLTEEKVAKSWAILSRWLESSARLDKVLRICKLLIKGARESDVGEALAKKPRRILTPAVVWSCLEYVVDTHGANGELRGLLTLSGFDERDFWHVWQEIFDPHQKVGHLYGPELIRISQQKTSTGKSLVMSEHDADLSWASKDDIEKSLQDDAGAVEDRSRILGWLLAQCLILPKWLRSEPLKIQEFLLSVPRDVEFLHQLSRQEIVGQVADRAGEILLG